MTASTVITGKKERGLGEKEKGEVEERMGEGENLNIAQREIKGISNERLKGNPELGDL